MTVKHLFGSLAIVALLAGCTVNTSPDSSIEQVQSVAFRSSEPPSLTVFTVINNRSGEGGHTALMVNGSQRVIFDPAGSFRDERVVERGDVIYGITPGWLNAYRSAHARVTHHVVSQEIPVTAAQAEQALRLVQANGPVAGAFCARSTTSILSQVDGFEDISPTFFPRRFMDQVATLPGVKTTRLFEDDDGKLIDGVRAQALAQAR